MISIDSIGVVAVASAGTPQKLSASSLQVRHVRMTACKISGGAFASNAGTVYIGKSTMNKTTGAGVYFKLAPEGVSSEDSPGDVYDLSQWYIDADTTGDGVLVGFA